MFTAILITAMAGGLAKMVSTPAGGLAIAGLVEALRQGITHLRRASGQGRLDAALAELRSEEVVRQVVAEELQRRGVPEDRLDEVLAAQVNAILRWTTDEIEAAARAAHGEIADLGARLDALQAAVETGLRRASIATLLAARPIAARRTLVPRTWWEIEEGPPPSSDGYLPEPATGILAPLNPHVYPLEHFAEVPCLVLLGEPGSGKSVELGRTFERARAGAAAGDAACWMDLATYGDEARLNGDLALLLEHGLQGDKTFHLFLDSLDECGLRVKQVAAIVSDRVGALDGAISRLRLRIACRMGEYPRQFDETFKRLFGDCFKKLGISRLKESDVRELAAAHHERIDVDAFLAAVRAANLEAFAALPVSLQMLFRLHGHGGLNRSVNELHLAGCEQLCSEHGLSRLDAGHHPGLSARERVAVASRLAACSIFGNRPWIYSGTGADAAFDDNLLRIDELVGGAESGRSVDTGAIREVLGTALFVRLDGDRFAFAHRTYAEFLAAHYLTSHAVPATAIFGLILDTGSSGGRVIPQLSETASWLTSQSRDVRDAVLTADPQLLLASSVLRGNDDLKVDVAKALLEGLQAGRIAHSDLDLSDSFENLRPNDPERLAAVIRPYLQDRSLDMLARSVATRIAMACLLRPVQNDLLAIVDDASEPQPLRSWAAVALRSVGSEDVMARLRPFANGRDDDTDDSVKGIALDVLFRRRDLSAREVFDRLTYPRTPHFHGAYSSFLYSLPGELEPSEIPVAIEWLIRAGDPHSVGTTFHVLGESLLARAWKHVDVEAVASGLARLALARARAFESVLPGRRSEGEEEAVSDDDRRKVVFRLLVEVTEWREEYGHLLRHGPALIRPEDQQWLLDIGPVLPAGAAQTARVEILWAITSMTGHSQASGVFEHLDRAADAELTLKARFDAVRKVDLASAEAERLRSNWKKHKEMEAQVEERRARKVDPQQRIATCLTAIGQGDLDGWWRLNMEMTLEETSTHYGDELEPDLTSLPGWTAADETTRERILSAARRYLVERAAAPATWLGTSRLDRPAFAGYRALLLVAKVRPSWLDDLQQDRWAAWAPIIVAYPGGMDHPEHRDSQAGLVVRAYRHASQEVLNAWTTLLRSEAADQHDHLFSIRVMSNCWDSRVADAIRPMLDSPSLGPNCLHQILQVLLDHGDERTFEHAVGLVGRVANEAGPELLKAKAAGLALLDQLGRPNWRHASSSIWTPIWSAVQRAPEYGKALIRGAVHPIGLPEARRWLDAIEPDQVADLALWLEAQFPWREEGYHGEGAHWVGPDESVAMFRDGLLPHLVGSATPAAAAAVRRIVDALPGRPYLRNYLHDAERAVRRANWHAVTPGEMIALAAGAARHAVDEA